LAIKAASIFLHKEVCLLFEEEKLGKSFSRREGGTAGRVLCAQGDKESV
jgi:hypothetical protein